MFLVDRAWTNQTDLHVVRFLRKIGNNMRNLRVQLTHRYNETEIREMTHMINRECRMALNELNTHLPMWSERWITSNRPIGKHRVILLSNPAALSVLKSSNWFTMQNPDPSDMFFLVRENRQWAGVVWWYASQHVTAFVPPTMRPSIQPHLPTQNLHFVPLWTTPNGHPATQEYGLLWVLCAMIHGTTPRPGLDDVLRFMRSTVRACYDPLLTSLRNQAGGDEFAPLRLLHYAREATIPDVVHAFGWPMD